MITKDELPLNEDDFQRWLSNMNYVLEDFFARFPPDIQKTLDYSVESLDVLEAWLLERYPNPKAAISEPDPMIFDGAARYIGETYRKTIGGYWWVDYEDFTMNGLPQITGSRSGPGAACPLAMATASTDRRRGDFLSHLLRIQIAKLPQ